MRGEWYMGAGAGRSEEGLVRGGGSNIMFGTNSARP